MKTFKIEDNTRMDVKKRKRKKKLAQEKAMTGFWALELFRTFIKTWEVPGDFLYSLIQMERTVARVARDWS